MSGNAASVLDAAARCRVCQPQLTHPTADDPNRVVTVTAHEGKTGQEMAITYTNYKVVGNGSFGVVFAAKMLRAYTVGAGHAPISGT